MSKFNLDTFIGITLPNIVVFSLVTFVLLIEPLFLIVLMVAIGLTIAVILDIFLYYSCECKDNSIIKRIIKTSYIVVTAYIISLMLYVTIQEFALINI